MVANDLIFNQNPIFANHVKKFFKMDDMFRIINYFRRNAATFYDEKPMKSFLFYVEESIYKIYEIIFFNSPDFQRFATKHINELESEIIKFDENVETATLSFAKVLLKHTEIFQLQ